MKPSAVAVAPPALTLTSTGPIPNTNPELTVTFSPAGKLGITPSLCFPINTNPCKSILHETSFASAVPTFAIVAFTPNPPEMLSIFIIATAPTVSK